jgi:hypothetical protein
MRFGALADVGHDLLRVRTPLKESSGTIKQAERRSYGGDRNGSA